MDQLVTYEQDGETSAASPAERVIEAIKASLPDDLLSRLNLDDPARAARLSAQARSYAQGWASALMARRVAELYRELTVGASVATTPYALRA